MYDIRTEGKVQGLRGEVTDNVRGVTTPERDQALVRVGTAEAVSDTLVRVGETTLLDHLILILNEELENKMSVGRLHISKNVP